MNKTPVFLLLLTVIGCSSGQTKEAPAVIPAANPSAYPVKPLVIGSTEEGWDADLRLSFTGEIAADASVTYKVNTVYEDKKIGFELVVPKKGSGKIIFRSVGEASDNFIRLLEKVYKQKASPVRKFTNSITVTGIDMLGYAKSLGAKEGGEYHVPAEYKIFFQGAKEDDYAELYLNINSSEHWIEWKEKDEEYRPVIISLLTKK
ncbi:MAG TPA: hypothetical protein VLD19_18565 [Chitinophagaceae bacterium]|nr:hypothetical protein [Chitinophagaceae bacterium]